MTSGDHYEALGVSRKATQDEIRRAYHQKSKQMHPDRFNQATQRREWEQANERLKALNHAYSVLRNPATRAAYDAEFAGGGAAKERASQVSPEQTWAAYERKFPANIHKGKARFEDLPKPVQDKLARRFRPGVKDQHLIKTEDPAHFYIWSILLLGWPWYLVASSSNGYRGGWLDVIDEFKWWTLFFSVMQAGFVIGGWKWHRSLIKPGVIFTPLYIIKTTIDTVEYWPIWSVRGIDALEHHRIFEEGGRSFYTHTDVTIRFDESSERITNLSKEGHHAIKRSWQKHIERAEQAAFRNDHSYFGENDDFLGYESSESIVDAEKKTSDEEFIAILVIVAVYFACLALALCIAIGR